KAAPTAFDGPGPRIAVYHGADAFLQNEYARALRESLQEELGEDAVETFRYDGADTPIADVLDECRSFDLMQRHKIVVVDNADTLIAGDNRPIMERYAAAPAANVTLVLRASRWNRGNLDKLILKVGVIEKCEPLSTAKAAGWAVKRAEKRHDAVLTREAATALVDRVGADIGRIDAELGKLAAAAPAGEPITPEIVREFVGLSREDEVWIIQRALTTGDPEVSLRVVNEAMRISRHASQLVWWAEADLARKLHTLARLLEEGVPEHTAPRQAKFWKQDEFKALNAYARHAGSRRLADLLARAVELDRRAKTGYSDADRACELLALAFADPNA
ncbi:MAG: DNA polymerase III subunit delta, partial [Phycisphaerales bacterium]